MSAGTFASDAHKNTARNRKERERYGEKGQEGYTGRMKKCSPIFTFRKLAVGRASLGQQEQCPKAFGARARAGYIGKGISESFEGR